MSLGRLYGSPEDPDAVAANNLAALGTVVVASMGNSGDVYEVGGSPGDAPRVLAVAASDDGNDVVDGLEVDSPAGIEPADTVDGTQDNVFAALKSVAYDWTAEPGVTNVPVVTVGDWSQDPNAGNNTDGCSAYSLADQAKVTGKVVMQMWLDGTGRRCGSAARAQARAGRGRHRRHLRQRRQRLLGRCDRRRRHPRDAHRQPGDAGHQGPGSTRPTRSASR